MEYDLKENEVEMFIFNLKCLFFNFKILGYPPPLGMSPTLSHTDIFIPYLVCWDLVTLRT